MHERPQKEPYTVVSWSGGKDSTATLILAHELGIAIDRVIMARLWFDRARGIPGEDQAHIRWVEERARPQLEAWGFPVEFVESERDYLYYFYFRRKRSPKHPETVGRCCGFPIARFCQMQKLKAEPLTRTFSHLRRQFALTAFTGICADEPERLARMHARGERSLLDEHGLTQADARELCRRYGLLSPTYRDGIKRGGCWFCPNASIGELAALKRNEPEKWRELEQLAAVPDTIARSFRYGRTFAEVNADVDRYLAQPVQMNIFDIYNDIGGSHAQL